MYRNPSNWPGEEGVVGSAQTRVATPLQAIGEIQSAIGSVTVRRDGGIVARVNVGDLVYQGDAIATGADGAIGIIFTDGTVFNLANDGRAVLNEFAYDPNATSNSALLSLTQGTFAFIAGRVAKTGGLRIDTPVARIRGGDGGIGILTLAALTFSAIHETEAASRQEALLDDGIIARYGTFEITTRDGRVVLADDPGETIVIDPTGAVARIPNTSSRMAELQQAQQNAMATLSLGQQGGGPPGSSGNPIGDQAPQIFQLAPQPINNTVGPGGIGNDNTNLFKENFIFVPPPQAAPPPPAPIISLTAIAITNPSTAISIVNASAAHAGFPIIGTTSGVEEGRTVTITIVNSANQVVYSGTATVTNGNWLVEISSAVAKLIPDGSYTVTADTSDAAGNPAPQATKSVLVDTIAAAPTALDLVAASDSGSSSADKITNVITPTVTGGGAEAGATVTLYDSDGTVLGTAVADASGNWTIISSPLSDGGHKLTATQFDLAGNASAISAALPIIVDTAAAAPSAPDMVAASDSFGPTGTDTDNITNNATPTLSGSGAEAGATVTLYDSDGTTVLGTAVADVLGKWTITSSLLSDGVHILTATQTDIAGNTGAISAALFVKVDTVVAAPSAPDLIAASDSFGPTGTDADNITNAATPTFTGSGAEAFATVTLFDSDGTTVRGTTTADVNGNWAITSSLLSDGDHALTVKQTDMAGNTSGASSLLGVHVDTAAAAPSAPDLIAASDSSGPTGTNTDDITNVSTPIVTGSGAEAFATVTLYDTNGTLLGTAVADVSGNWTITSSPLTDSAHNLTVKQVDVAGNTSVPSAGLSITVDTTAPNAPVITTFTDNSGSTLDHLTTDTTPTLTITAEAGSTVKVYQNGVFVGTATESTTGTFSFTSAALTDGSYNFTATATDAADNTSPASAPFAIIIDHTSASAPVITTFADNSGSTLDHLTTDTTPTLTITAEAGSTVKVYQNGVFVGTATESTTGTFSFTSAALTDGSYNFTATATDAADNTSPASAPFAIIIDHTLPSVPVITTFADNSGSTLDHLTTDTTPTLTITAEAGSTVRVYQNGVLVGTATETATPGTFTFTSAALTDGSYNFTATATDAADNTSAASAPFAIIIDHTLPSVPVITTFADNSGSTLDHLTTDTTPTLTITAEAGSTVRVYQNGVLVGTATETATPGTFTFTSAALPDNTYSFTATATDAADNTSAASAPFAIIIDHTLPSVPVITTFADNSGSTLDHLTTDTTPTLTITAEAGSTVRVYQNGVLVGTATETATPGTFTFTSAALPDNTYSFTATATDAADNTSAASAPFAIIIDHTLPSVPVITTFADNSGSTLDHLTTDTTPTLTITAEAGSTVRVYQNGVLVGTATETATPGTFTFTSAALPDNTYSFTATATDAADNTSAASAPFAIIIDHTLPSVPVITTFADNSGSTLDHLTTDTTPTLTITAEAGSTVRVYQNGVLVGTATETATPGTFTFTSAALPDNTYSFTATATDAADNTSAASAPFAIIIDHTLPSVPVITTFADNSGSTLDHLTTDTTPTLTITAEAGSTVRVYQNGVLVGTATETATPGTFTFTSAALPDNTYSFTATATDAADNTSAASAPFAIIIDHTLPSVPVITTFADNSGSTLDHLTTDTTPTLTITAEAGSTVRVYQNGVLVGTATETATPGTFTFTSAALPDNTYSFTATATDAADNTSAASAPFAIIIDHTLPSVPVITTFADNSGSTLDHLTTDTTPTLTITAEAGSTVRVYQNGVLVGTATETATPGTFTFTSAALPDNTYSFTATATDAADNTSAASAPFAIIIDHTLPSVPVITTFADNSGSTLDHLTTDTTPTLTITAEAGSTVRVYQNGVLVGTATETATPGTFTFTSAALPDNTYSFTATATDAADNTSAASAPFAIIIDHTAPSAVITTVTDNFGSVQGTVSNNGSTDDSTPTLTITAEAGSTVTIYQNGQPVGTATETATPGTFTFTPTTALTPGTYSFTATATDAAGNTSTLSNSYTITEASTLTIAANEVLVLKGETLTFDTIQNDGTIQVSSNPTSTIIGDISGAGVIEIKNNATLEIAGSVGPNLTVLFSVDPGGGANAKLILDDPSNFHAKISDFNGNDQIDFRTINFASVHITWADNAGVNTGGTLTIFDGTTTAIINFKDGDYTDLSFKLTNDGHGGTLITDPPVSTTTSDATVIPVAETPTLTATTADTQTNATAVAVDDGAVVALDIAVDPDGGEMLIINGAGATALDSGSLTLSGALMVDAGAFQLAIVSQRKRDDADGRHGDRANWNLQAASMSLGAAVLFLVENGTHTIAEAATTGGLFAVENDIADTLSGSGSVTVNSDAALKFSAISHSISGALEVTDGRLEIAGTASGTGLLNIDAEATLQFAGDDAVNVTLAGSTGELGSTWTFSDDGHGGAIVVHPDTGNNGSEPQSHELSSQAALHAPPEIPLARPNNDATNLSALNMEPGNRAAPASEFVTDHFHFGDANTGNHGVEPWSLADHSPPGLSAAANDVTSQAAQDPGPFGAAAAGDHGNSGHDGIGESHAGSMTHPDHSSPGLASAASDIASETAQDPGPPSAVAAGDHGKDSNPGHDGIGEAHAGNQAHSDHSSPALPSAADDIASQAAQDPGPPSAAAAGDHGKDSNPGHDGIGEAHAGNQAHSDHSSPGLASAANDIASQAAQDPGPPGAAHAGDHGKDSNPGQDGIGDSHGGNKAQSDHSSPGLGNAANNIAAQDPGPPSVAAAGDHGKDSNFGHDGLGESHGGNKTHADQASPALVAAGNGIAPEAAAQNPGAFGAAAVGDHGKDSNSGHDGIGDSHAGNKSHADQASPALAAAGNDIAPEAAAQNPGPFGAAAVGDHGKDSNSGHDGIGESHAGDNTHSDQASLALPSGANNVAPQAAQDPGAFGAAPVGDHGKDSNSGHDGIGESHAGDNTHSDQASLALPSGANNVAPQAAQDPGAFGAAPVGDHGKDSNSGHDGIGESHAGDKTLSDQPSPSLAAAANDPAPQAAQDPGSLGAAPVGDHAKDLFVFDANFGHDGIGQSHAGNVTQFDQASPALSTAANNVAPQAAQDPGPLGAAAAGDHAKDLFVFDANFGDDGIGQSHAGNMTQFDQPSSALPTAANNVAPQAAQDPGPLGAAAVGDHAKDLFVFDANFGHDGIGQSQAGNMTQFDQPIFETVSDILTTAEAHSAQAGLDPVAALGQNHDAAVTSVQKDKPLSDFIVYA